MVRKIVVSVLMMGFFACAASAQDKPDFSGTWKLNLSKSDFGPIPGPNSETVVIAQNGANVKEGVSYEDDQGKQGYDLVYTTDGTEVVYTPDSAPHISMVTLQKLKANWQGATLVVTETLKYQEDADVTGTISRSLSADGKVLTMDFDLMTPAGAMTRKYVFDRADAASAATAMAATAPSAATASAPGAMSAPAAASSGGNSGTPAPMASMSSGPKPNLSGTWKLNIAKSDFGQVPPPDSRVDTIEDNEPSIKITSVRTGGAMGNGTITTQFLTDGRETTSTILGSDAKSRAHWDGGSLMADVKTTMQGGDIEFKNIYTLAADGKSLMEGSHISSAMGEFDVKLVFDKQ
jgi:hypothetical protein